MRAIGSSFRAAAVFALTACGASHSPGEATTTPVAAGPEDGELGRFFPLEAGTVFSYETSSVPRRRTRAPHRAGQSTPRRQSGSPDGFAHRAARARVGRDRLGRRRLLLKTPLTSGSTWKGSLGHRPRRRHGRRRDVPAGHFEGCPDRRRVARGGVHARRHERLLPARRARRPRRTGELRGRRGSRNRAAQILRPARGRRERQRHDDVTTATPDRSAFRPSPDSATETERTPPAKERAAIARATAPRHGPRSARRNPVVRLHRRKGLVDWRVARRVHDDLGGGDRPQIALDGLVGPASVVTGESHGTDGNGPDVGFPNRQQM